MVEHQCKTLLVGEVRQDAADDFHGCIVRHKICAAIAVRVGDAEYTVDERLPLRGCRRMWIVDIFGQDVVRIDRQLYDLPIQPSV